MFTLHIEHAVGSFDEWKRMFDSDPLDRRNSGVRSYRVMRPVDDPDSVRIDLEFDSRRDAEAMKVALEKLWEGPAAAMLKNQTLQLSETVETTTF